MALDPRSIVRKFRSPRAGKTTAGPGFSLTKPYVPKRGVLGGRTFVIGRKPLRVYGRIGNLEVRLARSHSDIRRAQKLRYQVFFEEMSAIPDAQAVMRRRDEDRYDSYCDHVLVVDHGFNAEAKRRPWQRQPRVVGTYRLLRQEVAEAHGGFYTQGEYNIAPMVEARRGTHRFLELGRSCVLKPYRNRRSVELLWHGVWAYIREHKLDVMIGCASFEGTDPRAHAMALSFLHHYSLAPEDWRVRAHDDQYVSMNILPKEQVDPRQALKALPPLIKGYLRLGAFVGDGAVVDHQFGTTDVLMIMPVANIDERYFAHFGAPDDPVETLKGKKALN